MPKHRQRVKHCDDDGEVGDTLVVYNAIKTAVGFRELAREDPDKKEAMERALKGVARKATRLLQNYDDDDDLASVLAAMAQIRLKSQRTKLPDQLGSACARQVFEATLGACRLLNPCEEYVVHSERAADPLTRHFQNASMSAPSLPELDDGGSGSDGTAEHILVDMVSTSSVSGLSLPYPIYLLEFARSPQAFLAAILEGPELQSCRDALQHEDFSVVAGSGAKVLVSADVYETVIEATKGWNLKPRHVIVSAEFEGALTSALADVGAGVVPKNRGVLPPQPSIINRTFIEIPFPSSLRSAPHGPQVVSTTDANNRVKIKPRKA